ncbi:rod shape-determining protein MreD [Simonsiella muelleri]|uniref:Rod shape-determining protein MreD n=1 Tax=Simonsiella muelleri ATCC 29453 TaxID=641147 RepID=V9H8K7_9NEIS|nr:rod shape-determining protein MreD [Simonsiella muelleri]AUX61412.1 rod shape-determining protein MreD [Simonsiella muelleri ATCC 29453]EFG31068.1 rod shape-determining protein MreD [Simonsiella muelleri ATCC 29453]UBQ53465.1 rod shape-determining protein MreD [Simonsiella muelleri]
MSQLKDFYIRIPKKLIFISFLIALILDFIPVPTTLAWLPDATLLVLIFWLANCPHYINLGMSFIVGLLIDIGTTFSLGGHALAYVLAAYIIIINHRQFGVQNYGFQAVLVLISLLLSELVLMIIQFIDSHRFVGWATFIAPLVGAILWLPLSKLMNSLLHSQRFH